jgi:hypothetical protein
MLIDWYQKSPRGFNPAGEGGMVEEISGRSRLPVPRKLHRSSEITRNSESQKLATNRRRDSHGLDTAWADALTALTATRISFFFFFTLSKK